MKKRLWKIERIFEASRFAEDVITTSHQKLVPMPRRRAAKAAGQKPPGLQVCPQGIACKANSGGLR